MLQLIDTLSVQFSNYFISEHAVKYCGMSAESQNHEVSKDSHC
jgi:hypothetical protein